MRDAVSIPVPFFGGKEREMMALLGDATILGRRKAEAIEGKL